jgi:hypothetical protein
MSSVVLTLRLANNNELEVNWRHAPPAELTLAVTASSMLPSDVDETTYRLQFNNKRFIRVGDTLTYEEA